jgi:hypothetical protein
MGRRRTIATIVLAASILAGCASAATPPPPSGTLGAPPAGSPGPQTSSPGTPSASVPSTASAAPSASAASSLLACDLVTKQDASAAAGVSFPVGKDGKPKLADQMVVHTNCYFTNGAAPAANVLVEVVIYLPTVPVSTIEDVVVAKLLSRVGTNGGVTLAASKTTIAGNPGVTSLTTGEGVGGAPVHIELASYWKGQTVVSVTVGNSKAGAAVALATLVASKLP